MALSLDATSKRSDSNQWFALLGAVLGWELRRFLSRRATLIIAGGTFVLMVLEFWSIRSKASQIRTINGLQTQWTAPYAAASITAIVFVYITEFVGLFLPFLNVDRAAGDVRRRTSDLLMATVLPSWAYTWGRYLSGLLISIGLAALALPAYLVASLMLDGNLAALNLSTLLSVWALNVFCPVILLSGLSFALGTMLPRLSNVVKIVVLLGWVTDFLIARNFQTSHTQAWDPSSAAWMDISVSPPLRHADSPAAFIAQAQHMPDVSSIVAPHLALALIGLGAAFVASLTFRRFHNVA